MTGSKFHKVTNDAGKVFMIKVVRRGEAYGRNGCLTNDGEAAMEVYDYTRPDFDPDFPGCGQLVGRWNVSALLANDWPNGGLNLHGGVPAWYLDGAAFEEAMGFTVSYLG